MKLLDRISSPSEPFQFGLGTAMSEEEFQTQFVTWQKSPNLHVADFCVHGIEKYGTNERELNGKRIEVNVDF